ncbi:MAG TPA: MFS transporter [Dehalococcoidales bacterium]|nr:MFS transporter [Dehalococcoidales bacterium]
MHRFSPPAWVSLPLCLASINLLSNCAVETSIVFMSLYARDVGSSNLEVGFIAAATGIAFLLSSLWFGRLSDTHGRMKFIRIGLGLSALAYLSQILAGTPLTLMAARGFVGFAVGINSSVIMAYTYEHQKQIGNFVSYGALGWLIGAIVAAIVENYHALFIISAAVSALAFFVSFLLKEEATSRVQVTTFPLRLIRADYRIYLAFFFRQLGGTAIWTVWPLYLASLGASKLWIAVMDASNMVGQIVAMRFVERFNPAKMFQTGLIISVVVFAIYGAVSHYLPLVFVQLFLAVGWSTLLIGALSYLLRQSQERGTVAGLLNSTMSLSGSLGPFLGGAASQAWGYVSVMYLGTGISFLAFLSSLGLKTPKGAKATDAQPPHPHW